jgi:putative tricarboxylic transport membrane protein
VKLPVLTGSFSFSAFIVMRGFIVVMKKTAFADMATGIFLMLLSAYWFHEANKMMTVELGLGPGDYPKVVSTGLFILGFILTVQSVIKGFPKPSFKIDKKAILRLVIFVAVTFIYVQLLRTLGFILLTPFYLFFGCWFFGYRRLIIAAIASVGVTAFVYVVFRMIFMVILPQFRLF